MHIAVLTPHIGTHMQASACWKMCSCERKPWITCSCQLLSVLARWAACASRWGLANLSSFSILLQTTQLVLAVPAMGIKVTFCSDARCIDPMGALDHDRPASGH